MLGRRRRRARDAREEFFAAAGGHTGHVSVEIDGVTYLVSTADGSVGRRLFVSRRRAELSVLSRALERVEPRGVFVDVGANIGTATLPALASFADAIAIEPEPRNALLLRANLALNGLAGRAVVHELLCSDANAELTLRLSRNQGGHKVRPAKPHKESIQVQAVVLDDLVGGEDVGLIWVDVEGHEPHVLRGARTLLERGTPLVVEIEVGNAAEVADLLAGRTLYDLRAGVPIEALEPYLGALEGRGFTDVLAL